MHEHEDGAHARLLEEDGLVNDVKTKNRHCGVVFAVVLILSVSVVCSIKYQQLATALIKFARWLQGFGYMGLAAYVMIFVLATFVGCPTMGIEIIGGFVYPIGVAVPVNIIAKAIGSNGCFFLARTVLRPSIERKMAVHSSKLARLDEAVAQSQYKATVLSRYLPFPYTVLNYGMGLCAVSTKCFAISSTAGDTPYTILVVVCAGQLKDITQVLRGEADLGGGTVAMLVCGAVAAVLMSLAAGVMVRRVFAQEDSVKNDS